MGRRQGLDLSESLEALRLLSLSLVDAQPEKTVEALIDWISGMQIRIDALERRVERDKRLIKKAREQAIRLGDLEAENRALRLILQKK